MLLVTAEIQQMTENLFMGWAHKFKALVVQGESEEEVKRELLISLRAKIAFDYDLPITNVNAEELTSEALEHYFKKVEVENQYNVQLV